ncbi:hypothetical protein KW499_18355 [Vibrio fluvialis]|nr:hypothetical protein [Vibrio fluvialis]
MSRKPISEKELLEGMTPKTAHADELATTSEEDWGYAQYMGKSGVFF